MSSPSIIFATGLLLIVIGLWGVLTQPHLLRMIVGFALIDTGIHMAMVAIGYVSGGTAPILDADVDKLQAHLQVVDPIPSALVLTAIVIGLGVTAVMLVYAIQLHKQKHTLLVKDFTE